MTWENAPTKPKEDDVGFVYEIWDRERKLYYIGQKRFWKVIKYPPLKGKINKRHITVESDWRTYDSSNKEIQALMKHNPDRFIKRITRICKGKMEMNCWETYLQLQYYVTGNWDKLYNEVINLRGTIPKGEKK